MSALNISSFIWRIADDVLRDVYVRGKCGDVILPMTIVRLLDPVLEPTKDAVLRMKAQVDEAGRTPELSTTRPWRVPLPISWQTKLFKQFSENDSFRQWLSDMVYATTYLAPAAAVSGPGTKVD